MHFQEENYAPPIANQKSQSTIKTQIKRRNIFRKS